MSNFFLRNYHLKGCFHRLILIFLIPLIVTQISVIYFFYERHELDKLYTKKSFEIVDKMPMNKFIKDRNFKKIFLYFQIINRRQI